MTDGRTPQPAYAKPPQKTSDRTRRSLALLRSLTRDLGWRYALYLPGAIGLSAIFLLPPRFLQFFTENADRIDEVSARNLLTIMALFGLGVALALWISTFLGGLLREWLRLRVGLQLRRRSLNAIHATSLETFDGSHRGDWMTRVTSDLHNVEDFVSDSLPRQVQSLTLVLGSAFLFLAHSGLLALVPCLTALLLAWLNVRVQRRMAPALTEARELESEVFQDLIESYEGWRTIRSAGAAKTVSDRFETRLQSVKHTAMRIIRSMAGLMGVNEFAGQVVITGVLSLLTWFLSQGQLRVSDVLVYPFFINIFFGNARLLADAAFDWNRFFVEGGRLADLLDTAPNPTKEIRTPASPVSCDRITALELSAGYAGHSPLFPPRNLELCRGEILAILGPSGSGKSTLLEVLSGLRMPLSGRFRTSLDSETRSHLSESLSLLVEQRPYFFVGSLRENLLLGQPSDSQPSDPEIGVRLEELGLRQAIEQRGGLDAILSDRGLNFSEGQRYRLALCRALLTDRPFLLLDEPFASVDPETIERLVSVLQKEQNRGRGIVLATHQIPANLEPRILDLTDSTPQVPETMPV